MTASPPVLFLGTYLLLACLPLVCTALLAVVKLPPPPGGRAMPAACRGREIVLRPAFVAATVTGMVACGTMKEVVS